MRKVNPHDVTLHQTIALLTHARATGDTEAICKVRQCFSRDSSVARDALGWCACAVEDMLAQEYADETGEDEAQWARGDDPRDMRNINSPVDDQRKREFHARYQAIEYASRDLTWGEAREAVYHDDNEGEDE